MFKKIFNRVVAKLQSFNRNESALQDAVGIVQALIAIVVVGAIGLFIADTTLTTTSLQETDVNATGTLNITGNVSCGQWVNITLPNGNWTYYQMNFTTPVEGCTLSSNAIAIPLNAPPAGNTSTNASTAFETAFNDDDSNNISGAIVATNPSDSVVVLTYQTAGTAGNAVTTTDTVPGGWAAATLTGGLDASDVAAMQTNLLDAGQTGASFIVILVIAFIGSIAMAYMFGMFGNKRK